MYNIIFQALLFRARTFLSSCGHPPGVPPSLNPSGVRGRRDASATGLLVEQHSRAELRLQNVPAMSPYQTYRAQRWAPRKGIPHAAVRKR
jgi:hypothetical protein